MASLDSAGGGGGSAANGDDVTETQAWVLSTIPRQTEWSILRKCCHCWGWGWYTFCRVCCGDSQCAREMAIACRHDGNGQKKCQNIMTPCNLPGFPKIRGWSTSNFDGCSWAMTSMILQGLRGFSVSQCRSTWLDAVRSGPSEGRGQRQPNNQHPSDCDNVRRGPLKLRWVQWTAILQRGCLVGCRWEWMGTSGLQKCLNAMEGMVEDSSRD